MNESEGQNHIGLNFELMYRQLSGENRKHKEDLHLVITTSASIELMIDYGVQSAKTRSSKLRILSTKQGQFESKVQALVNAAMMSKDTQTNIRILRNIRNNYAHTLPIPATKLRRHFALLKDIRVESDFLRALPNDSIKYQLVGVACMHELIDNCDRKFPGSVLHLEYAGGGFKLIDE